MENPGTPSATNSQRVIGLTGGIGMGKTTVSNHLAQAHHIPVLDADIYAREAVQPGSALLEEIVDRYGSGILQLNGTLNRPRLGDIVFSSPAERLWLEQHIHPYVRDRLVATMQSPPFNDPIRYPILVLVIPLLFEARMTHLVTEIWVTYCTYEQQMERLMQRDHLSFEQVQNRISSQYAIEKKLERADVILDNSATPECLLHQVDQAVVQFPSARKKLGN